MPVNPTKDSISISVEMKYISHGGGVGKPDEGIRYPAPDEVREKVQRLLQMVRDKKTEIKEAVFDSIEIKLQSINDNVQKVKDPTVIASSAQRFMTELREREKYVQNCMTEAKYCCCGYIEISKPQFLKKELEEFCERLNSFNRILEGIQYEVRREVQRLLQAVQKKKTQFQKAVFDSIELNLQSIDVNIQKVKDPKAIATSAQTLMEELREREKHVHNCMSKAKYYCVWCIEKSKPQFLEKELEEFNERLKSFNRILVDMLEAEARSIKKTQSGTGDSSRTIPEKIEKQNKKLTRSNAMRTSSDKTSSDTNNTENSDQSTYGISPEVKGQIENHQSSNTTQRKEGKPQNAAHLGVSSNFTHLGISSNTSRDVQPSNFTHSGVSSNTLRDVQPCNYTRLGISSNTSRDVKPSNFTHTGISSNTPRETNKESNSAPVVPLKPSGDRGSSTTDLEKDSAKMPKLKEIESIQLQAKPAPVMNLNLESFQPEIKPVQQQMKPAPTPNSKKESIQLNIYPRFEAEPVQQQTKPAPDLNSKKESIQLQNYPRFEAEPVQQHIKPSLVKNLKTDPPEVETEPIQLQQCVKASGFNNI